MIHLEVFLASGYAIVLVLIGCGFEWMALQKEREAIASADPIDPSLTHLKAAQFHRGLALVVCSCAIYILIIVAVRHPALPSLGLLCTVACAPALLISRIARPFVSSFRRT
jgi:hypothetical protein